MTIYQAAFHALMIDDPGDKIDAVNALANTVDRVGVSKSIPASQPVRRIAAPGRPKKPLLVAPHLVPRRKSGTQTGRSIQFHAFAHIEFNAINLALDAVYRFRDMPDDYYVDWLKVAVEEGKHFLLLTDYLAEQGVSYGDFEAHNNLWDMAVNTDHDVLVRMALVPRVLEARGLDVTPKIIEKLEHVGDQQAVDILQKIYRDEIGHVAIGSRWFNYVCKARQIDPQATFKQLIAEYTRGYLSGPFNRPAREAAGFCGEELDALEAMEEMFAQAPKSVQS